MKNFTENDWITLESELRELMRENRVRDVAQDRLFVKRCLHTKRQRNIQGMIFYPGWDSNQH